MALPTDVASTLESGTRPLTGQYLIPPHTPAVTFGLISGLKWGPPTVDQNPQNCKPKETLLASKTILLGTLVTDAN